MKKYKAYTIDFAMKSTLVAVMAAFALPVLAASDLEYLKEQLAEQKRALENQQLLISKLEKQLNANAAVARPVAQENSAIKNVTSKMEVEIYGGLIPFAETVSATGATTVAPGNRPNQLAVGNYTGANSEHRGRVTVGTSHIGFRGSLAVSEDFRAIWQLESGAALDGDGGGIGNTNVFGLRNSNVGVASKYGTLFIGNWDTPYKFISIPTVPLKGATTFEYNSLIGNPGFGVFGTTTISGRGASKADASFDRRQGNSIQYWTPNWNGFSGRFAYSLGETKTANIPGPAVEPQVLSMSLGYRGDAWSVNYAYEEHKDYFGMSQIGGAAASATNRSSKDTGHKLVGIYNFKNTGTTLTGIYERLKYQNDDTGAAANVKSYERDAYVVAVHQQVGPGKAWISYGNAKDGSCTLIGSTACSTSGLGARLWNIGYVQSVNKLVDLYAAFYEVQNKESGTYQPVNSVGVAPNAVPAPGLVIRGLGVGAVMNF